MRRGFNFLLGILAVALAAGMLAYFTGWIPKPSLDGGKGKKFTPEELQLIEGLAHSNITIRVGNIPDSPPIDFYDTKSDRRVGATWDYLKLIEQEIGVHFVWTESENWEKDLLQGRIDLVGSVQNTPDRRQIFQFTRNYLKIPVVILARKDSSKIFSLENMGGKKVAVVNGSAIHDHLLKIQYFDPDKYDYLVVPVNDSKDGMHKVTDGTLDCMVADRAVSLYYLPMLGVNLREAGKVDYSWDLCFAAGNDSPLPATILNKALLHITMTQKSTILKDWPTLRNATNLEMELLFKIIGGTLLIILASICAVVFWNRTLRRQITQQLTELGTVRQSHAQTTRALDESLERFRILVETSNDIIWETDHYGCYLYVSPRIYEILGYTAQELIGRSSLSLMTTVDAARRMEMLRRRTVDSTIDCEISTFIHKNGKQVILESNGKAFANSAGELAGFRGVSRDITDRIANENALRRSEERFRNLVETTSDWIWEVDIDGCYTYASPQSTALLGYEPDELLGKHFTALMPPEEAKDIITKFTETVKAGEAIQSLVNINRHRNGHTVVLEMSAVPFYDENWVIKGYRGIDRDITDRVAAERQLEFERNLFHSFMEHAPHLIYFKNTEGRFIEVNAAKAAELQLPSGKIIGRTDFNFLPYEQALQKFEDELEVMRTQKPIQKEEVATTPEGIKWYLTTKAPHYDEHGNVVGTFGTSWDITYRKKTEEQLRQLRALLSNTINSMPSILVGVDEEGRVIQWNRQAESSTGLNSAGAVGQYLRDAFPELAKEMVKVERAIREQKPQEEERVRVEQDNRTRYRNITVFPLMGGETEGAVIRVDDVTDRVMLENSIRNIVEGVAAVGRRFFNSMVTQLARTLDADFTFISEFVDESNEFMRTIAVSDKGSIGTNFDYVLATAPCRRVLEGDRFLYVDNVRELFPEMDMFKRLEIDGYIGIPLVNSENKALGIMVAMYQKPIENVEFASSIMQVFAGRTSAELERLQATKELIALRNLLENIVNSMPSILIGIDADRRIMQWNREAERVSGIPPSHAQGQLLDRVLPDFGADVKKVLENFNSQQPQHYERLHSSIKGEPRIVDVTLYPITTDSSEGAVIRLDDVTDRVRIEEMMVQSEKMMSVGGLAAGMAHEINNPLAGILQNLQVIRNRIMHNTDRNTNAAVKVGTTLEAIQAYMQSRDLIKMLDSTTEAGRRAAKIVDNMLSFSRKDESNFAPNDLADVIERSIDLASNDYNLKKRFDFRHIQIIREFENLGLIECEASQIQQVMLNLLSNSAQAMAKRRPNAPEPRITIRLKRDQDMALIEVEDNGPGMDAETRKRAFEPFFTTKEVGHGTGLGLSVSFFIITENHGGTMNVVSSPGRGARFSFRIPFVHRMERWGLRL